MAICQEIGSKRVISIAFSQMGIISQNQSNYDKAMDFAEISYNKRTGIISYLGLNAIRYPELKNNQRYIALLKKMNLPLQKSD